MNQILECERLVVSHPENKTKITVMASAGIAGIWFSGGPDKDQIAIYSKNGETAIGIYDHDKGEIHALDISIAVQNGKVSLGGVDSEGNYISLTADDFRKLKALITPSEQ